MPDVDKQPLSISGASFDQLLPSIVDGLVPLQRKILHVHFQRKLEIKIGELVKRVSTVCSKGSTRSEIEECVDKLARNFVGSNNINYLESYGDHGTRRQGGKDATQDQSYRTIIPALTRVIFPVLEEYGSKYNWALSSEPEVYIPALPMILVNGFEASDQDRKTSIPPYNPEDIISNLRRRIEGGSKEVMQPMQPWYRDWTGYKERLDRNHYSLQGMIQESSEAVVEVTELPPRMWTQDFLDTLNQYMSEPESLVKSYTEHAENQGVRFRITLKDPCTGVATLRILQTKLGLHKTISTQDMVALDEEGRACRYATVLDILEDFYHIRTRHYLKEKNRLLQKSQRDLQLSIDKLRFVELLLEGSIDVSQDEDNLVKVLIDHGFTPISNDVSSESKKRKRSTDNA
jgi:DNA topoisomerase-2